MKRYMNEFVGLTVAPQLLGKNLFPNAKEITESMGMFNAVRDYLRQSLNIRFQDNNVNIVVVGDGHTPRTGALFATRTKWQAYSIDPVLNMKNWNITRLSCISKKIEDVGLLSIPSDHHIILILPHAHVTISQCLKACPNLSAIVALPCCVPIRHTINADIEYVDDGIWSNKNTIKIWSNLRKH